MKNVLFFPGLGEKPKQYSAYSNYMNIANIDWNTGKHNLKMTPDSVIVSFSLGATFPLEYSVKHKVKKIILCSPTPFESLDKCKFEELVFIIGEKEKFLIKVAKELKKGRKNVKLVIVPKADHRITKTYFDFIKRELV